MYIHSELNIVYSYARGYNIGDNGDNGGYNIRWWILYGIQYSLMNIVWYSIHW